MIAFKDQFILNQKELHKQLKISQVDYKLPDSYLEKNIIMYNHEKYLI